ncbi:MAG: hypothetical protein LLF83_08505 [Methanobacterium sp.]|nr:hypothetical protein [Methanobacterium sp.]
MLDERGQGSVEFIFVTLIVFMIIGGLVSIVSNETNQAQTGDVAQTRMTAEKMAEIINTVYINGVGYTISLTVPNDMIVYVNNPTIGYLTVYSITANKNITVKLIPKNVQTTTLNTGNIYNVTYNNTGNITFKQL